MAAQKFPARPGRWVVVLMVAAVVLSAASVAVLTLLTPDGAGFNTRGGYLPVASR